MNGSETGTPLKGFWDRWAVHYRRICLSPAYQRFLDDTMAEAKVGQHHQCLDLGAGPCFLSIRMRQAGCRVDAVDSSMEMRKYALDHIAKEGIADGLRLHSRDVLEFLQSAPDESYDVATASLFLAYIPGPEGVVREVYRVLRPGGRFILSNPVPHANFAAIFWRSGWRAFRYLFSALRLLKYAREITTLESYGLFHFAGLDETIRLLQGAGFVVNRGQVRLVYAGTTYLFKALKPLPGTAPPRDLPERRLTSASPLRVTPPSSTRPAPAAPSGPGRPG